MATETSPAQPQVTAPVVNSSQVPSAPIIDMRTMLVTPDLAQQWLGVNYEANRTLRPDRVSAYARDMKAGKWQLTGESIKISDKNELIDGQHRLSAVIEAGVPVYMVVAMNVPTTAFKVIDSALGRTMGDRFKGITPNNRKQLGAVIRRVLAWQRKDYVGRTQITHTEQMDAFEADPSGFAAAAAHGVDVSRQKICSPAVGGTAFYLFHLIDAEDALVFFDHLKTGANLPENHPILTVRNRMTQSYVKRGGRLNSDDQLALLIRAWNAFRQKRTLDRAVIVTEGKVNNQNFPMPV